MSNKIRARLRVATPAALAPLNGLSTPRRADGVFVFVSDTGAGRGAWYEFVAGAVAGDVAASDSTGYWIKQETGGGVLSFNGRSGTVSPAAGDYAIGDLANIAANTLAGNNTGSPAPPAALTASQVRALLDLEVGTDVQAFSALLAAIVSGFGAASAGQVPTKSGSTLAYATPTATVADGAVTTAKLADDAVTTAKLANAIVDSLGLADSALQPGDALDATDLTGSIDPARIATNALALAQMAQITGPALLGKLTAGAGNVSAVAIQAFMGTFLGAADEAAARNAIGAGGGVSWARCKGTTPIEILASSGANAPTSFVRNSTGVYTFTRPAAVDANYEWWSFGSNNADSNGFMHSRDRAFTQTTTQFRVMTLNTSFAFSDQPEFTVFVL